MNLIKSIKNLNRFDKFLWLGSVAALILVFSLGGGDWTTLVTSLVGVTSLIFLAKGDAIGQLIVMGFGILYSWVSWRYRYYSEMITYLGMTFPTALAALITWLKNPYTEREVKVSPMSRPKWLLLILSTGIVTTLFHYILAWLDTPNLVLSTVSIATSFFAATLMILRSPFYAIGYALNDVVLIGLWVMAAIESIEYLPMVLCFGIFLINDLYAFRNWCIMEKRQRSAV